MDAIESAKALKGSFSQIQNDESILIRLKELYRLVTGLELKDCCLLCIKRAYDIVISHFNL